LINYCIVSFDKGVPPHFPRKTHCRRYIIYNYILPTW